ncbi:helix-turn-helix transcriptional regulator [Bartonella sp. DGB2]|uniref:helix-turn-helix transcriptional regulator n=1 Tax=Bartonella sp. DGB2 TaxID=3388426 RepID=UPI00398F9A32
MEKSFLNQVDLSRRWGISARTLEQWRWRGEGPAFIKIGRVVRYRAEDIRHYEKQHILTCSGQTIPSYTNNSQKTQEEMDAVGGDQ